MPSRLPPLTALRAFEAAARHLSFQQAAAELHVTPAALSFQIKALEQHLGQPLFRRLNRAVELTEAGRTLAGGATEGFDRLARAWRATRRLSDHGALTVTAGPAFTAKWLAPRLFAFAQAHPEIELRFSASLRLMDFDRDEIDLAIRFGFGPDEGLHSTTLIREWLTPMMAPHLAEPLKTPADLGQVPLLHQDDTAAFRPPMDWAAWFQLAGVPLPDNHGPRFSQADHALDAAEAGGGAVLGRISLAERALADGRLVAPFPLALYNGTSYRAICPRGAETRPHIKAFLDWVSSEAATIKALEAGRTLRPAPEGQP